MDGNYSIQVLQGINNNYYLEALKTLSLGMIAI